MKTIRSFWCAISGVGVAFSEPHMRFHLVAACYVMYFSLFYDLSKAEYSALFVVIALVMVSECINTAIETLCDKVTSEKNEMIKKTKDVSAGAVLLCAVLAAAVGVNLFWDAQVFGAIYTYFSVGLTRIIPLLASVFVSVMFVSGRVFSSGKGKKHD